MIDPQTFTVVDYQITDNKGEYWTTEFTFSENLEEEYLDCLTTDELHYGNPYAFSSLGELHPDKLVYHLKTKHTFANNEPQEQWNTIRKAEASTQLKAISAYLQEHLRLYIGRINAEHQQFKVEQAEQATQDIQDAFELEDLNDFLDSNKDD